MKGGQILGATAGDLTKHWQYQHGQFTSGKNRYNVDMKSIDMAYRL